jgi:hypothetical protein
LLIAAIGWYYLFYSRAASNLSSVEAMALNLRRARLRRLGGFLLLILAAVLYVGIAGVDWDKPTIWFAVTWIGVLVLLGTVTLLALIDLRWTSQLRRRKDREGQ